MTRQSLITQTTTNDLLVNTGTPNKGDGDPLRNAFIKLNEIIAKADANFTELYATDTATKYHLGDDVQFIDIDPDSGTIVIQSGFDTGMPVYIKGANCSDGGVGGNVVIEAGGPGLPNDGTTGNIELAAQQTTIESDNNMWSFRDDGVLELPLGGSIVDSDGNNILDGLGVDITAFGEGFGLDNADKIVTNKLYSTNLTQPTQHYRLELDTNGIVILPDQSIINGSTLRGIYGTGEANYTGITIGPDANHREESWVWVDHTGVSIATEYSTDAYTWKFDNSGKLTFPNGSTIGDGDAVSGVPITTTRGSILIGNQAECIGGENHFHIMKAGQQAIDLFLGDDNNYVKLPSTGGVEISSSELGAQHYWTFGTDGNLTLPGTGTISNAAGAGTSFTATTISGTPGDTKEFVSGSDVDTVTTSWTATGGGISGTATITNVTVGLSATTVQFDQSFTASGPITFTNGLGVTTLELSPDGTTTWTFGTNGALTFPSGILADLGGAEFGTGFSLTTDGDQAIIGASNLISLETSGGYGQLSLTQDEETTTGGLSIFFQNGSGTLWTFNEADSSLTFPDNLKIASSVISNLVVADPISTGSQIQVGSGVEADTGIIISNGVTNAVDSSVLSAGSLVNVNGTTAAMMNQVFNSLGEGGPSLTSQQLVEVSANNVVIGLRIINAGVEDPVTAFSGWTFTAETGRTTFPNGTVPEHSYGAAGDKEGMVVFDDTYIYYCTADYVNNTTDIWKRTAHGAGSW
jgi:hypothetical protein